MEEDMTRSDIIRLLALAEGISQKAAKTAVDVAFESLRKAILRGDRIEIRGLGSFKVKYYEGYNGRKPRNGETIQVKPKKRPVFKMGKELKIRLNGKVQ